MNISKNQIWVLIGIVAIGVIALVSDVEVKVEVGTDYEREKCIEANTQEIRPENRIKDCDKFVGRGGDPGDFTKCVDGMEPGSQKLLERLAKDEAIKICNSQRIY